MGSNGRRTAGPGWALVFLVALVALPMVPARSLPQFGDPAKAPAGYTLDLEQWRRLMCFDARSLQANVRCSVDRATWTLTLEVPAAAVRVQLPGGPGTDG